MNDEAVYRTAPATPGLLNIMKKTQDMQCVFKKMVSLIVKLKVV